jgi:membrane protein YfhO
VIGEARQAAARHPDRMAVAALATLVLALFAPAILGRGVFFQRDLHSYWYPHIENAVQAVAEGGWPTWTPYVAFGRPLLADPSLQLLYPPTWLNLVMRSATYYTVFAVTHVWAAGCGLYLLGRAGGLSVPAALLAGALWAASGPLLSAVNLFHHFAGAAWMPWVLLAVGHALRHPTLRSSLMLGAAGGGQALAGSADMGLLTALGAAAYAALFVWQRPDGRRERLAACARVAAVGVGFACLLGAAQWLPAAALLRRAARAAQGVAVSSAWSVHPASLVDLLVPRLVADLPLHDQARALVFDGRGPFLVCLYLGAASLPLVGLAIAGQAHPLRRWALVALAFFLVASLGRHTPLYGVLAAVPPLSLLRYPAKYMVPAALFWSLLAGLGLDLWTAAWSAAVRRRALVVAAACAGLVLGAALAAHWVSTSPVALTRWLGPGGSSGVGPAAGKLWQSVGTLAAALILLGVRAARPAGAGWLTAAMCALAIVDVARVGRHVNPLAPRALVEYRPPIAARVASAGGEPRLYVRQESAADLNALLVRGPGGWDSEVGWALGAQETLVPPIGARWRIAGSYDGDFTGLAPPALSLFSLMLPQLAAEATSVKLLQVGAVTHVASLREHPVPALAEVGEFPSVYAKPVRLFRVPDPLPRVYVVGAARPAAAHEALVALADPLFDARHEVLLPGTARGRAPGFAASVRVRWRRMDALATDVELSEPGWLVVVEAYEPGWTGRVDGRPAPVLVANGLFRAVAVPAGAHHVELRYRPPGLRAGLFLSSLAVMGGLLVMTVRPRENGRAR